MKRMVNSVNVTYENRFVRFICPTLQGKILLWGAALNKRQRFLSWLLDTSLPWSSSANVAGCAQTHSETPDSVLLEKQI